MSSDCGNKGNVKSVFLIAPRAVYIIVFDLLLVILLSVTCH